jgi:hypothetical protein
VTKIEDLAAELLAQPLEKFTSARNARAKELKASGQTDLAGLLSALKKPSVSLWAANRGARSDPALLRELRQSAQALAKTQAAAGTRRANAAQELRRASEDFQQKLDAASHAAAAALRQGEHPAGEETVRRAREIYRIAALKGGETWEQLQKGALAGEPQPADDVAEMFASSAAATGKSAERQEQQRVAAAAEKTARADDQRAKEATATALRLRQEATAAASAAQRAADRAAAAEEEAARARAQAEKSRQATKGRRP